ncbi:unnamed protein product, partial [Mesorhabditis belari]|uniref:Enoyl reductase (ER) domain-containing protein n=1 Tax=Mesorhabditis belari TaxID=2138241 RepID=A0AAF3FEB7_9BILA
MFTGAFLRRFLSTQQGMRAAVLSEFGGPEKILIEHAHTRPTAVLDSQILIKVACSGVNPVDTYVRAGVYPILPNLPYIVGRDGSGIVEEIGKHVHNVKKGDRVWVTNMGNGTAADYCVVEKAGLLPDGVTFEEGTCIGIPYLTAYTALFHNGSADARGEKRKKRLLVHGASGAVGLAAIQLAAAHPQTFDIVVGTAGSEEGVKFVQENGGNHCVNHRKDGYIQELKDKFKGFDLVLEMNAHLNLNKSIDLLSMNGRVVVIGSRGQIDFDPRSLMKKDASVIGCGLSNSLEGTFKEYSAAITHFFANTKFRPRIAQVYELEDVSKAHAAVTAGGPTNGQVVVRVAKL